MKLNSILHLSHKPPFPKRDGGSVAVYELASLLANSSCYVKTLSFSTQKHTLHIDVHEKQLAEHLQIEAMPVNTAFNYAEAFWGIWMSKTIPYSLKRFFCGKSAKKIEDVLEKKHFDAVVFDGIQGLVYLPVIKKFPHLKLIYRAHNIEYQIAFEQLTQEKQALKRLLVKRNAKILQHFEEDVWRKMNEIWCISYSDLQIIQSKTTDTDLKILPFTLPDSNETVPWHTPMKFGFIGALDWSPNVHGISWYFKEVWPHLLPFEHDFHLAGKSGDAGFKKSIPKEVIFLGEVPNSEHFLKSLQVLVVPLFSGSGVRVKIIESLRLGVPVICSPKAVEGLDEDIQNCTLVCHSSAEWIQAIQEISCNKQLWISLSEKGRAFFVTHHLRDTFAATFHKDFLKI